MSIENFYFHCGDEWSDPYCDSFHNDRCPVCNAEIEPYKSKDDNDPETVHHPLSNELAFDFVSAMIVATTNLIDKVTGIRGIDIEMYVGEQIEKASQAKSAAGHALSDGEQDDPFTVALGAGDHLHSALDFLVSDLEGIRGIEIDMYAPSEIDKATKAVNDWTNYRNILEERNEEAS